MVAYLGAETRASRLVFGGDHSLHDQSFRPRELLTGSVNADGYGVVWYAGGRPARLASPFPIWQGPDLEGVLDTVRAPLVVAALRNTTPGIPAAHTAVPPLTVDRWTFVLNGFVENFRARFMRPLHALVPDALFGRLTGVSDTEALALLSAAACSDGLEVDRALDRVARQVVEMVQAAGATAQLNMVLTDGQTLAAVRTSSVGVSNSLYVCTGGTTWPAGTVVASEPLTRNDRWTAVPHGGTVRVDDDGCSVSEGGA